MSQKVLKEIHNKALKKVPVIKPGYTIEVDTIIREGNKQRVQKFKGLVIAVNGTASNEMITIRKISYGVGVEKKLPLHSPNVGDIKVIKTEPTRRSKLYFMRDRIGKNAMRIKKGKATFISDTDELEMISPEEYEVEMPLVAESQTDTSVDEVVEATTQDVEQESSEVQENNVEETFSEESAKEEPTKDESSAESDANQETK